MAPKRFPNIPTQWFTSIIAKHAVTSLRHGLKGNHRDGRRGNSTDRTETMTYEKISWYGGTRRRNEEEQQREQEEEPPAEYWEERERRYKRQNREDSDQ